MSSNNMCRICLGHGFLTNIFENRDSERISSRVMCLAKINISPSDGLPDKICVVCIKKLDNCTAFINLCQESDLKLKTSLNKNGAEEPQSGLEIDLNNENYSLGIEYDHFSDCNLITEDDIKDQAFEVTEPVPLGKRNRSTKENKLRNDSKSSKYKKKTVKQQCFTCGKVMSSRFRLKTHLRIHTGERPFSCPHCNKNFSLEQNLKVHMRVHTGEKPLQCSVCGESFAQTAGLAAHRRKHTGQTPYHCVLCPRSFRTIGHLQYHVRRHTGEKNFECDTCSKAFITRSGLKQHLVTHTGDRPHVCSVCGKRMSRASHVKRHMQQTHERIACNHCPEKHDSEKHKETHGSEKNARCDENTDK